MMRHLRRLPALSAVALLLAMLTAVAVAAPAAAGYANAYDTKKTWLHNNPANDWDPACTHREITLVGGHYNWGEYLDGSHGYMKTLYLGAGTYRWSDCLDPQNGYYWHWSELDPVNPAWNSVTFENQFLRITKSGLHTWGSYLDPQF